MENKECGKCRVWKMSNVENEECGKCGVCGNANHTPYFPHSTFSTPIFHTSYFPHSTFSTLPLPHTAFSRFNVCQIYRFPFFCLHFSVHLMCLYFGKFRLHGNLRIFFKILHTMFSFDGQYKRRRAVSLGGASRKVIFPLFCNCK